MTLLITLFAAMISTVVWYLSSSAKKLKIGTLVLTYWGATIMWTVDAVADYMELRVEYFSPTATDILNDALLGVTVVAFGFLIWVIILLVKDPKGVWREYCSFSKNMLD